MRVLLIEDEPGLVLTISDLLSGEGYEVEIAQDGEAGLRMASEGVFDAIILDLMLPKKNGLEVCRELRGKGIDTAVLMLTARGQVIDRVVGLKLGADDYLTKPFDPAELLARLEALLRRVNKENRIAVETFEFSDVFVDFRRAEVRRAGQPVNLASKELQLLRYLIDNRERVVPREEIMRKVWEYASDASSRTIDTHVAWLRQKLEENAQSPRHNQTIRGKGYRFTAAREVPAVRTQQS
jgi:two-component system alkaline phosphatase synthesis response regulator PhoP